MLSEKAVLVRESISSKIKTSLPSIALNKTLSSSLWAWTGLLVILVLRRSCMRSRTFPNTSSWVSIAVSIRDWKHSFSVSSIFDISI